MGGGSTGKATRPTGVLTLTRQKEPTGEFLPDPPSPDRHGCAYAQESLPAKQAKHAVSPAATHQGCSASTHSCSDFVPAKTRRSSARSRVLSHGLGSCVKTKPLRRRAVRSVLTHQRAMRGSG